MKTCKDCGAVKAITEFHTESGGHGLRAACKPCWAKRGLSWYQRNKEKGRATRRINNKKHRISGANIASRYGLTLSEYSALIEKHNGVCAICSKPERTRKRSRLSVDHDHDTGVVRGLLCSYCNMALGMFYHDPKLLQAAIAYLKQTTDG